MAGDEPDEDGEEKPEYESDAERLEAAADLLDAVDYRRLSNQQAQELRSARDRAESVASGMDTEGEG